MNEHEKRKTEHKTNHARGRKSRINRLYTELIYRKRLSNENKKLNTKRANHKQT